MKLDLSGLFDEIVELIHDIIDQTNTPEALNRRIVRLEARQAVHPTAHRAGRIASIKAKLASAKA